MALAAKANNSSADASKSDKELSSPEIQPNFKPTASERLAEMKTSIKQKGASLDEASQHGSEGSVSDLEASLAEYSKLRSSSKRAKTSIKWSYNQTASIATRSQTEKMKA